MPVLTGLALQGPQSRSRLFHEIVVRSHSVEGCLRTTQLLTAQTLPIQLSARVLPGMNIVQCPRDLETVSFRVRTSIPFERED
jgi:hypothetical protein